MKLVEIGDKMKVLHFSKSWKGLPQYQETKFVKISDEMASLIHAVDNNSIKFSTQHYANWLSLDTARFTQNFVIMNSWIKWYKVIWDSVMGKMKVGKINACRLY